MRLSLATCLLLFCSSSQSGYMESSNEDMHIHEATEIQKMKKEIIKMKNEVGKLKDALEERIDQLENLMKVSILRSCAEYSRYGLRTSRLYMIDPDGKSQGQEPFQVYCNFTSGATEVMHDTEKITDVDNCHDPGCYHKKISYINGLTSQPIGMTQILSLIELAEYCQQEFRFDSILFPRNRNGSDSAWWQDRHGQNNTYSEGSNHGRDCHYDFDNSTSGYRYCYNERGWFYGNITNMNVLPIMKMYFGGHQNSVENEEVGAFQISRLKCYGEKDVENSTSWDPPTSCSSLKKRGAMISGYYNIKPVGITQPKLVFCDMKSDSYADVTQIEQVDDSPLGTITAWVSKPSGAGSPVQLADGWVLCDGSLIKKGIWAGVRTPDLNSGHFLRGGNLDQQLQMEEDQLQDHKHTDPGHSHTASSSSSASSHEHSYYDSYMDGSVDRLSTWMVPQTTYRYCGCDGCGCNSYDLPKYHSKNTGSIETNISTSTSVNSQTTGITGISSSYNHGAETRPKNMKVSWIMKCW